MAARKGPMVKAVEGDIAELAKRAAELKMSALAALALAMAREIDDPGNSATSKSMCAARLIDALEELRALAPPKREMDGVDDLASARERRRAVAGRAATANPAGS